MLCAEDDCNVGPILVQFLSTFGFDAELADDGPVALARLTARPDHFHVLITDNQMPTMPGYVLSARARDAGFRGPIIVYSASVKETELQAYHACGAITVVDKASGARSLLAALKAAVASGAA